MKKKEAIQRPSRGALPVAEIKRRRDFEILFAEIEQHVQLLSNTVSWIRLFDSLNMAR